MARRRRQAVTFTISFLDVMCCAFGVMVLLFLVIKHNPVTAAVAKSASPDLSSEVKLLQKEILDGQQNLAELKNTIAEVDEQDVIAEGLARRIADEIKKKEGNAETREADRASEENAAMRLRIEELEKKRDLILAEGKATGEDTRAYSGEGTRQYLTGLQVGGERILVLLDISASMLDETLVNVIRRKNMTDARKTGSVKWRQAVATLDWLTTRFPASSKFQVYLFNTGVKSAVPGTEGQWLSVSDASRLDAAVDAARAAIPEGGTSLQLAFQEISRLRPLPDNVFLITDGLPTQGATAPRRSGNVSGNERFKLFNAAANQVPNGVPINTILLPMEGDPMAAFSFWGLAVASGGSFLSPAADWP